MVCLSFFLSSPRLSFSSVKPFHLSVINLSFVTVNRTSLSSASQNHRLHKKKALSTHDKHTHIKWIPIFLCPGTNSIQCCFCFTTTVIFFTITLSVISQWGIFWFPLVLPFGLPADLSPSLTLSFPVFVLFLRSVALLSTCQRFLQSCNSVWCYFMSLPTTSTVNLRPLLIYCLFGCSWYYHESRGAFVCLV